MTLLKMKMMMNDQELLDCFLGGDTDCFADVYNRFYKSFLSTAKHQYSLVHEDAEDVVQDFFLKSFENFDKYVPEKGTLKDFMERSFKNHVIDFIRKERRKGFQSELEEHILMTNPHEDKDYKDALQSIIDDVVVDPLYREIFDKYMEGVPQRNLHIYYRDLAPQKINNIISSSIRSIKNYAKKTYK